MPVESQNFRFAEFVLDVRDHCIRRNGSEIHLPPKTFDTLLALVRHHGHLVTKQQLLDAVWPGVAVTENVLTRCIKEVRAALGDEAQAPRLVETVPRLGYRFIAPVEAVAPAEDTDTRATVSPAASEAPDLGARASRPDEGGRARSGWWTGRRALLLGLFVVVLVLLPAFALRSKPALSFQPRGFILVTDFDNRSGETVLEGALGTAFIVSLEQSKYVNVLPRSRAREVLQRMGQPADRHIDEEAGREVCVREGIRGLLAVGITRAGRRYAIAARLVDPQTGSSVRSYVESADGTDALLPALQALAGDVRRDLGESLSSIRQSDRQLQDVTTSSLQALKFYSDGVALWLKGEYGAAVELYQAAVREDPNFAKAHAALGTAYFSHVATLDPERGKAHYEKALQASGRTTEREALGIRMQYEADLGHLDTARDLFTAYLRSYPDDIRARYTFATFLMRSNQSAEAAAHFQAIVGLAPTYTAAHVNLATSCMNLGRYQEALDAYAKAFALEPAWISRGNLNHEYGFLLLKSGQAAKAREVFERALTTESSKAGALRSLALLDLFEGRYAEARQRLEQAVQLTSARGFLVNVARNQLFMAMVLDGQGRRDQAIAALDEAARAASSAKAGVWLTARVAAAYARLGEVRRAQPLLETLRRDCDMKSAEQRSDLHRAEGEVAWARGDGARALASLTLADDERHGPLTVESLARAARRRGDADTAIRHYLALLEMEGLSLGWEPQQDFVAARYALAMLYWSRSKPAPAREMLDRFLSGWSQADPDLPLLVSAKRLRASIGAADSGSTR